MDFDNRFLSATGVHRWAGDEQFQWSFSWDEDRNRDAFVNTSLGVPVVVSDPDGEIAKRFAGFAGSLVEKLGL